MAARKVQSYSGIRVRGRSLELIELRAIQMRNLLKLPSGRLDPLNVAVRAEHAYPHLKTLRVTAERLAGDHARAMVSPPRILVDPRLVFEPAREAELRFAILHELAHLVLHFDELIALQDRPPSRSSGYTENSEWQANIMAAAVAAPIEMVVAAGSADELAELSGLPRERVLFRYERAQQASRHPLPILDYIEFAASDQS